MYEQLLLHGKLRGEAPAILRASGSKCDGIVYYDVVTKPRAPLYIGLTVRIHRIKDHPFELNRREPYGSYKAESTGLVGTITGIRSMEKEVTEFILTVEDRRYSAWNKYACITVPHIPGVTVELSSWHTFLRWLVLPYLPDTKSIALEKDAVVEDRTMPWREIEPEPGCWD